MQDIISIGILRKAILRQALLLRNPIWYRAVLDIIIDWAIIFIAWYLCCYLGGIFYFLSVLVIGNRQRALGNLLHDASHYSLFKKRSINDFIANIFMGLPLSSLLRYYRVDHDKHHKFLGDKNDPDFIHKEKYASCSIMQIIIENVFHFKSWKISTLGYLPKMSFREFLYYIIWWIIIMSCLIFIFDLQKAFLFFILWYVSKATVFHFITIMRELSDHVGLNPIGLLEFTRNNPVRSGLKYFFHPHNNNWHLVHHIVPYVPHYNLYKIDQSLRQLFPSYKNLHHCDGYIIGKHPLAKCLNGQCNLDK